MLTRLLRELAFARHIPPRQILARVVKAGRIGAERVIRPRLGRIDVAPVRMPPLPLFAPRAASLRRAAGGWDYSALGHSVRFAPSIDWNAPGPAGRDQLWRMTLHYMEYLEAIDDEALAEVLHQWTAANPPFAPQAAHRGWNAYALSLRVVVWMQQLALRRERLSPEVLAPAHRSLMEQLDYLGRHLEVDLGGNHLLKNIKALMWAGSYFDGAAAKEWRRKAERLLRRELGTQMLADGMHYERSPSYHCQVFADLLEIRAVMPPGALAVEVDDVLVRAARVVADLGHPDGLVAQFSDAGLLMAYAPGECLAAYSGTGGTVADPRARFAYEQAGYFGGRGEGSFVVVDAGPIAPDRLPAHGHGDIGSFEWSVSGQRMIVDQGVFEYLAGAKREISRSAANHNTLSIPGMDQAAFFGAFRSAFRARVTAREYAPTPTGFILEVEHDGFRRSGGPLHRRRIEVAGGHVRIEDRIDRPLAGPAFVTVLLHPDVTAKGDDAGEHNAGQILLSHAKARAKLVASGPVDVEEWFWWPNIGCEQPTMRLRLTIPPGEQTAWMEFSVTD